MRIVAMSISKEVTVFKKLSRFALIGKRALLALAALAIFAASAMLSTTASADSTPDTEPAIVKTGEDGLTYGYAASFDYGHEPDYIKAIATNGKEGYVKKTELLAAEHQATTPEEALRISKEHDDALLAAFTDELGKVIGCDRIDSKSASELLSAKLSDPSISPDEAEATPFAIDGKQISSEQVDQALANAAISISTPIPVYAEDGTTIIGEFLVG